MSLVYDHPREVYFKGKWRRTAHLMSNFPNPTATSVELRAFAHQLRLKPEWIQHEGTEHEHFDLFDGAIHRARSGRAALCALALLARNS